MTISFDISADELPIFLSEVDEHLQTLDEILIHLERLSDPDALQAAFRAAHTLKGMAGVIGHTRMVALTHALEAVLDGVRKNQLQISSPLIDLCLDAIDGLRHLREEVVTGEEYDLEVEAMSRRFDSFLSPAAAQNAQAAQTLAQSVAQAEASSAPTAAPEVDETLPLVRVQVDIDPHSIASAARAFQVMLALQDVGEILAMKPTQAMIETVAPVKQLLATVRTGHPCDEIRRILSIISEINTIQVYEDLPLPIGEVSEAVEAGAEAATQADLTPAGQATAASVPTPSGSGRMAELQPTAAKETPKKVDMMVRTSVERLDVLMGLVGELITDRNRLSQIRGSMENERRGDEHVDNLSDTVTHLSRITDQLQEEIMRIRMLPIGNVFHKFPRLVRDLAQRTGKKIDLVMNGEDTELDRSVIDEINDPLIHLLRNSVDHGIETPEERLAAGKSDRGTITLSAWHEQGRIYVTVEDDGRGINLDRLKRSAVSKGLITEEESKNYSDEKAVELIFMSGLSTAAAVTDISGRGVGMDIVRNNIQRVSGTITVNTAPNKGTQFQVILPLTLAIVPTLLVKVSGLTFAIPLVMVAETLRLQDASISTVQGNRVTVLRGKVLPLLHVADVLRLEKQNEHAQYTYVVVINHGKQQVGIMVDALMGEQEVVVKSLGKIIGDVPGLSSAAILGDGGISLIIDVTGLLRLSSVHW